ncbi:hypothetical protein BSKO_11621 [Bryopsis sp. KO-2023]|nr:hypothetical protein BSKO_11621 [Bryopsis sp. KO-2023]
MKSSGAILLILLGLEMIYATPIIGVTEVERPKVDLAAKKAEKEVVDTFSFNGIKIEKLKKRDCALQSCGEITEECGWCALSAVDSSEGFGLKYEKVDETLEVPCPDAEPTPRGLVKLCERTRATITVSDDCPGKRKIGLVRSQYTFYNEDCPNDGLEPFKPKTIPGTPENAPFFFPPADVIANLG